MWTGRGGMCPWFLRLWGGAADSTDGSYTGYTFMSHRFQVPLYDKHQGTKN